MLKYSNSIREADRDYNIPQTTPWRYIIDTKKQKPESECIQKIYGHKADRFYVYLWCVANGIHLFCNGEL